MRSWRKFSAAERAQLKSGVLASLVAEQEQGVRAALVQLVGSLARHELEAGSGGWPEVMELIQQRVVSQAWTCWRTTCNLPPEAQVQPALESPSQQVQRAAYQAVAVSVEGCQEHIHTKYLPSMLAIMSRGIAHPEPCVRNATLYMLGQFSEFIQPEISNHAPDTLPVLLAHMDEAFRHLKPGDKESSTLSRIFNDLDLLRAVDLCAGLEGAPPLLQVHLPPPHHLLITF